MATETGEVQQEGASAAFEVHLELFEGPLALLLHLIEKNNLNILDIPIAHITREYLEYLELMKTLEIDVTGEFLVMATTLMQIKTKMLLPRPDEVKEDDPRQELVSRLLLYQQFSKISRELEAKARRAEEFAPRPSPVFERGQMVLVQNVYDLFGAFRTILENWKEAQGSSAAIGKDPHPVESKIAKILSMFETRETLSLAEVFEGEPTRHALVACFLALLELVKRGFVTAMQEAAFGGIYLAKTNREAPGRRGDPESPVHNEDKDAGDE